MNPHTVQSNTTNRNLQAQTGPAEPAVAENPPPLLDVQPVEVPQAIEIRAELAAVEDLADHQSIEAKEEEVEEPLSSPKPLELKLDTLLALPSELQSKILGHMTMQSLDDLAPLLEMIAQLVRMLEVLENAQRSADTISNLRKLAQLALENGNSTPKLSASIAALLETIDAEVELLQASGVEEGLASKISKLRALARFAVENVRIDRLDLSNKDTYGQFKNCKQQLKAIVGGKSGVFAFKLVEHITLDLNQLDILPKFFSSSRSVTIHAKAIVEVSRYCTRVLGKLSNLTQLILNNCTQLTDISSLGQLSNLTHLQLNVCKQLSDISALGQLSNLTELRLNSCKQLRDISPLSQLSNLAHLMLAGSKQLTDISPLGQLSNLTYLMLAGSKQLTDISPLGQLSNLTYFILTYCLKLIDISPLRKLSNLTRLMLDGCPKLIDISPLGQLSNLTRLMLDDCPKLIDISPLGQLSNLTHLRLDDCKQLTDIRPLTQLTHLQFLDVRHCPLDDASLAILDDLSANKNVKVQFESE